MELKGKTALVIGASGGFGAATSRRFVHAGAKVILADIDVEAVAVLASETGGLALEVDITDEQEVERMVSEAEAKCGPIDIGVNYAGFEESIPLKKLSGAKLQAMLDVHVNGAFYFVRYTARAMSRGGSLINISSVNVPLTGHGLGAYSAAKAAVEKLTRVAALEYGPQGIRVNAVAPSLIETPMTAQIFRFPGVVEAFIEETPLGRMGTMEDVVNAVFWLAGDGSSFITGQVIQVDGGLTLNRLPTQKQIKLIAEAMQREKGK